MPKLDRLYQHWSVHVATAGLLRLLPSIQLPSARRKSGPILQILHPDRERPWNFAKRQWQGQVVYFYCPAPVARAGCLWPIFCCKGRNANGLSSLSWTGSPFLLLNACSKGRQSTITPGDEAGVCTAEEVCLLAIDAHRSF